MPVTINGTTGVVFPDGVTQGSGVPTASGTSGAPLVSNGTIYTQNTAVGAAFGGTGLTSPGTAGNVLTSNGSAWVSQAAAAFDAGTVMLFAQTSAPTGWTKDTTNYNNSGLRIVTGAASTGGSVDFTTAFASQTPSGSVSISSITGSAGATTLSVPQIPSHSHPSAAVSPFTAAASENGNFATPGSTGATGGSGSHNHPFSFSGGSASFSGNAINLAVKYVDVIRATKN